ncbi:MAG: indole-3-glycerol phosphate synthase TrpC [Rhodovibrionaceae bacterium]|nr:indole-3-glycerol phosphate synthase TrpC [Rhodovibrionaceae bacterium]
MSQAASPTAEAAGDVLASICADKLRHVEQRKREADIARLEDAAKQTSAPRGFAEALVRNADADGFALICEIKKASPSKGLIRANFDPPALARAYEAGGAACLSVLTDEPYFQGRDADLSQAREATTLPVLRKDFMLDPYQVVESRALGADCILLIMAALSDAQAAELEAAAREHRMDVLVEVHDADELERALRLETPLVGINNRNLKTLEVDLQTTIELAPRVPDDRLLICESGLSSRADLVRMQAHGARAFLIGESLMRHDDVSAATAALLGR